jgi:hypothetical protein
LFAHVRLYFQRSDADLLQKHSFKATQKEYKTSMEEYTGKSNNACQALPLLVHFLFTLSPTRQAITHHSSHPTFQAQTALRNPTNTKTQNKSTFSTHA